MQGRKKKVSDDTLIKDSKHLTIAQMSEKYGYSKGHVVRRCRELSVRPIGYGDHYNLDIKKEHVNQRTSGKFDLVDVICKNHYTVKCNACGYVFDITADTIRHGTTMCRQCKKERDKQNQKRKEEYKLWQKKCQIRKVIKLLSKEIDRRTPKQCAYCGNEFYSDDSRSVYCSDKCQRKHSGHGHKARARHYGVEYVPGINLKVVARRDNNICQLCGKPVDWNDNSWSESFGPLYPTIDHIIPMKHGGGHTWSNVQLAHAKCNSYKRDLVDFDEISKVIERGATG